MISQDGSFQVQDATQDTFCHQVMTSKLAIVDFWAPWCGPCLRFAPVFERVAFEAYRNNPGAVLFLKVNVDNEMNLAVTYGITMIPTIAAFAGKNMLERYKGPPTPAGFARWVNQLLEA